MQKLLITKFKPRTERKSRAKFNSVITRAKQKHNARNKK